MSNKPYKRNERLGVQLLDMVKKAAWTLHGHIATFTAIKLSKDFKYADIYLHTENQDDINLLQESEKTIINKIKPEWNAKYIPNLRFHIDKEAVRLERLNNIYNREDF